MWRFCNDNPKLLGGGVRTAGFISETDLYYETIRLYETINPDKKIHTVLYEDILSEIVNKDPIIKKDLDSVIVTFDNISCNGLNKDSSKMLEGIKTLADGLPIIGATAGADWEYPLYFCLYWDGAHLRGYIPRYGNTLNTYTKTSFGCELESVCYELYNEKIKNYMINAFGYIGNHESKCIDKFMSYCRLEPNQFYALVCGDNKDACFLNDDALMTDIKTKIVLYCDTLSRIRKR